MAIIDIVRIIFALIAVLGMIGACAVMVRRLPVMNRVMSGERRLQLVETLGLDAKRRLVIVRCDDAEHLIVLGPAGETVIARDLDAVQDQQNPAPVKPSFASLLSTKTQAQKTQFEKTQLEKKQADTNSDRQAA